jgi:undecaprenyl-diphosphatase
MNIFQAIVLGIVQGVTEFIPISSSAHLIIVPWLLNWQDPGLTFDVALHMGTLVALLLFFAGDWIRLIRAGIDSIREGKIGDDPDRRLAWLLAIGCIPGAIAGVLFESKLDELFHQPNAPHNTAAMIAMGTIIVLLGTILFIVERVARHLRELRQVSLKDAILVGCAQALAIFPGVSRSGSTITAGLMVGLERESAARFSFLLAAPIIAGAGAKSALEVVGSLRQGSMPPSELVYFAVGFVAALISGYLCIKVLLAFLQAHSTDIFVYYRWLLGVFVILVAVFRG